MSRRVERAVRGRARAGAGTWPSGVALELRRIIVGADPDAVPLRCRLHRHAYVAVHDNPENRRYVSHHCRRCGHVKDDGRGESRPQDGLVWGASTGVH